VEVNKIYDIDCLEGLKYIDSGSVDMLFVDLPYGTTRNKWDVIIPPNELWAEYERIIKPNGAILLFGQDKFTAKMMLSNEKLHRYNIIWKKVLSTGFLNANRQPLREHEDIMVFYKKQPTYNPQKYEGAKCHSKGKAKGTSSTDGNNHNYGDFTVMETTGNMKHPTSVWEFSKPHPSIAIHPTEKPVELCRYAIRTYSNPGDLVVDHCCGSGSIPLAAALEGRRYIGMDNGVCEKRGSDYYMRKWADIASERIAKALVTA